MLDKETAVLPCAAVGVIALLDRHHRNAWNIAAMIFFTLLTAGWWYVFLSTTTLRWCRFAIGALVDPSSGMPWYSHFQWLYGDLGMMGSLLLIVGIVASTGLAMHSGFSYPRRPYGWWPSFVMVMTYAAFTACRNKSPWFTMFVYPSLATLQALGITAVTTACATHAPRMRPVVACIAAACGATMLVLAATGTHEGHQQRVMPGAWARAARTRAIATEINKRIRPHERLLATRLGFYGAPTFDIPCPTFVYYLTNVQRAIISCTSSFTVCATIISNNSIDWVLISPTPELRDTMTNGFKMCYNLNPAVVLDDGTSFLYRTTFVNGSITPPLRPRPKAQ